MFVYKEGVHFCHLIFVQTIQLTSIGGLLIEQDFILCETF